tara:strand:+ start:666 stop:1211 length:546 start_codon:yes stop_codon:yes gene_type:complete
VNRDTARVALAAIAAAELAAGAARFTERGKVFAAAQARAKALGRPLVVVGDPDAGAQTRIARAYGCGDLCLDLNDCPKCPTSQASDLTTGTSPVPRDSAVVYCSCVLEYVPDVHAAIAELRRMAGSDANLFMTRVQPVTLTAYLYPGAQWTLSPTLKATTVCPYRKAALVAGLGWLAWSAR